MLVSTYQPEGYNERKAHVCQYLNSSFYQNIVLWKKPNYMAKTACFWLVYILRKCPVWILAGTWTILRYWVIYISTSNSATTASFHNLSNISSTYPTPWRKALLEKLTVPQSVKKSPMFCTLWNIKVNYRGNNGPIQRQINTLHAISSYFLQIYKNTIFLRRLSRPRYRLHSGFPTYSNFPSFLSITLLLHLMFLICLL